MKTLVANQIREIRAIALSENFSREQMNRARPVFLLTFTDGSKLVVKAEMKSSGMSHGNLAEKSAQFGGMLMGRVDQNLQTEFCQQAEVNALSALPQQLFAPVDKAALCREFLHITIQSGRFFFYKMPFFDGFRNLDSIIKAEKIEKLLGKMHRDRTMLYDLAKIVAVDLFIGNEDRFLSDGRISNESNIAFQKDPDKRYTPLGMDFFHSTNDLANLFTPPPDYWGGWKLRSRQDMEQFGRTAIESLNALFRKNLPSNYPSSMYLNASHVSNFVMGMVKGTDEIKSFLLGRVRMGQRLPSGVMKRLEGLGWLATTQPGTGGAPLRIGAHR